MVEFIFILCYVNSCFVCTEQEGLTVSCTFYKWIDSHLEGLPYLCCVNLPFLQKNPAIEVCKWGRTEAAEEHESFHGGTEVLWSCRVRGFKRAFKKFERPAGKVKKALGWFEMAPLEPRETPSELVESRRLLGSFERRKKGFNKWKCSVLGAGDWFLWRGRWKEYRHCNLLLFWHLCSAAGCTPVTIPGSEMEEKQGWWFFFISKPEEQIQVCILCQGIKFVCVC